MKKMGLPVIYDVTHSLQRPSAAKGISGGDREFVLPMACAGVACGVDGLFLEVHPEPSQAKSDSATSFYLDKMENLVEKIMRIRGVVND
jgi:2-dehydro-3-deoxyphosphooctonate aldolase (KDO 8-P synthase)